MSPDRIQKLLFLRLKWPVAEPCSRKIRLNEISTVSVLLLHRNIAHPDSHPIQLFSNARSIDKWGAVAPEVEFRVFTLPLRLSTNFQTQEIVTEFPYVILLASRLILIHLKVLNLYFLSRFPKYLHNFASKNLNV